MGVVMERWRARDGEGNGEGENDGAWIDSKRKKATMT